MLSQHNTTKGYHKKTPHTKQPNTYHRRRTTFFPTSTCLRPSSFPPPLGNVWRRLWRSSEPLPRSHTCCPVECTPRCSLGEPPFGTWQSIGCNDAMVQHNGIMEQWNNAMMQHNETMEYTEKKEQHQVSTTIFKCITQCNHSIKRYHIEQPSIITQYHNPVS